MDDEIVQRMVTLVRRIATPPSVAPGVNVKSWYAEALEIAKLLPVPVDPDVLAVKAIADKWENDFVTPLPSARRTSLESAIMEGIRHARDDGWIEWHGGDCPVPRGTKTMVRFRNDMERTDSEPEEWEWGRFPGNISSDIVAYRVVK